MFVKQQSSLCTRRLRQELDGFQDLHERYKRVVEENRNLYNTVQDLRGNIRVFCRYVLCWSGCWLTWYCPAAAPVRALSACLALLPGHQPQATAGLTAV